MENVLTEDKMSKILDYSYDKAVNGLGNFETAEEIGRKYIEKYGDVEKAINKLIDYQKMKCATSGFLTGVGGAITLPVAIPANITSVVYVQTRMIATIASMRGYNLNDDQVKTIVFVSLTGRAAGDILKQAGIKIGMKAAENAIKKKIPGEVLKAINKKVGFRLVTKFGQKGVINLGKCIPAVGGIIGGGADFVGTDIIARTAKKNFI